MGEFFKPWRRKAGCVLLVMALTSWGAWVRSVSILDGASLPVGRHRLMQLWSAHQTLTWVNEYDANIEVTGDYLGWASFPIATSSHDDARIRWLCKWIGFGIADAIDYPVTPRSFRPATILSIPYWFITISLTLLSAYLILWPNKRVKSATQTGPPNPFSN